LIRAAAAPDEWANKGRLAAFKMVGYLASSGHLVLFDDICAQTGAINLAADAKTLHDSTNVTRCFLLLRRIRQI
jgi:type II secretory pathway component PulC